MENIYTNLIVHLSQYATGFFRLLRFRFNMHSRFGVFDKVVFQSIIALDQVQFTQKYYD